MTIEVTWHDIQKGIKCDQLNCPVALAANRAMLDPVGVSSSSIWTDSRNGYSLPSEVTDWIKRFDDGEPVEPITFNIDIE